ncbi:TetR/AcrR family transcriptional regulator [Mycolicibacterium flavescens]|uniref:TetR family transcriptional regulator n=1 Tax=Mycolicibacterium flavescens TaxID=1776 RepID=A0A1E3RKX7_MYCFV|nr:TetR family transcriptional regulator [Mycolicibacterium flavescens]MCV7279051.1 TetR/AcrR family transcriptional regulator [Mycolicibacterium flavescens]ODQ90536.1 TetR family transcriptional regulator [Mycolicibacterium flavescens]
MASARARDARATRADILAAARRRFGADGFERTTLRAVAADVGIDPALVIRYFGSKQELFAAAAQFTLDLPDLTEVSPDDVADALLPRFFAVWEHDTTFVALLRAAMTSSTAAETMRQVFATQVAPALTKVTPDHPAQRAGLMGAFVIGLATTRYVLANPAVADLSHDELIAWARPVIRQLLVGPAPS